MTLKSSQMESSIWIIVTHLVFKQLPQYWLNTSVKWVKTLNMTRRPSSTWPAQQQVHQHVQSVLKKLNTVDQLLVIPFAVTGRSKPLRTSSLVYSLLPLGWEHHIRMCPRCSALSDTESGRLDWSAGSADARRNQTLEEEEEEQQVQCESEPYSNITRGPCLCFMWWYNKSVFNSILLTLSPGYDVKALM